MDKFPPIYPIHHSARQYLSSSLTLLEKEIYLTTLSIFYAVKRDELEKTTRNVIAWMGIIYAIPRNVWSTVSVWFYV